MIQEYSSRLEVMHLFRYESKANRLPVSISEP